jgi:membrane protease YdiL (CAAX protease family)
LSPEDILFTLIGVFLLGVVVVAASYADQRRSSRARLAVIGVLVLVNILLALNGVAQVLSAYSSGLGGSDPPGKADAWGAFLVSIMIAGLATVILFQPMAERIAVFFPRFRGKEKRQLDELFFSEPVQPESFSPSEPLFPQMLNYYTTDSIMVPRPSAPEHSSWPVQTAEKEPESYQVRGFNPASMVHLVAVAYCLYFLGVQFISFILGGGLQGVAETYQEEGLSGWDLILNAVPFLVLSFLGVGLGLRRDLSQSLKRLGLGIPTGRGVLVSFGVTIGLFIFVVMVASLWAAIVPEDVYKEQTQASDALSNSVKTIGLAFLLAATAAVGEEIAFRGALQPVFGFWPTAIIFSLTHIQYTLTPAWLIIFGVALTFGWIRLHYNTTVSILTHFLYNFIGLALTVAIPHETWIDILRIF